VSLRDRRACIAILARAALASIPIRQRSPGRARCARGGARADGEKSGAVASSEVIPSNEPGQAIVAAKNHPRCDLIVQSDSS